MISRAPKYVFLFSIPAGLAMPGIGFKAVRALIPISEVLTLLGFVPRTGTDRQLRGPCPIHRSSSSSSTSFSVNLAKNAYQCFKCGSAGNQLDLWAAATKTGLHEAARDLCNRLNREVPWLRSKASDGTEKRNP